MINFNKENVNNLILNVFNFYNGRINVFNKAVLDVNWANQWDSYNGGYSRLPNIVIINPLVIARHANSIYDMYVMIIETIIHELYHTDQFIEYARMNMDKDYNDKIEAATECQTMIYIVNHTKEIFDNFSIKIIIKNEVIQKIMNHWDSYNHFYHRRKLYDQLYMCVSIGFYRQYAIRNNVKYADMLYDTIKNMIVNNKKIILNIGEDNLVICDGNYKCTFEDINNIFYKYYTHTYYDINYEIVYNDDTLYINLSITNSDLMCKKTII